MKKILIFSIVLICILYSAGCNEKSEPVVINIDNSGDVSSEAVGVNALIKIADCLYYDSTTQIVYLWNGNIQHNHATTPTPYYATNGLPYRYNPETSTLEKISVAE